MTEFMTKEWAEEARTAINSFPDDDYRETKLFMFWDWIDAAKQGFEGSWSIGVRGLGANGSSGDRYATFTFSGGQCTGAEISDAKPEATFVLSGNYETWKDILQGYDAGKAVMYRRLRLDDGDVFRFFNRIYMFTESLIAISKIPATLPN